MVLLSFQTWMTVVRHEVRASSKSPVLIGLTSLFCGYLIIRVSLRILQGAPTDAAMLQAFDLNQAVLPILALFFGFNAITRLRDSKRINVIMSLPVARTEAFLAVLVARIVLLVVAVLISYLVVGSVLGFTGGGVHIEHLSRFVIHALSLSIAMLGFAVGVSAAVRTQQQALIIVSTFILFIWSERALGLVYPDDIYHFIGLSPPLIDSIPYMLLELLNPWIVGSIFGTEFLGIGFNPYSAPPTFAVAALVSWFVIPIVLGHWQFSKDDF